MWTSVGGGCDGGERARIERGWDGKGRRAAAWIACDCDSTCRGFILDSEVCDKEHTTRQRDERW